MLMKRILIVGAGGQIGSELTVYLRKIYGDHNVVATDMRECKALGEAGPFEVLNALDATAMASVVARYHIDTIFNLVALLSAVGERNPQMAWNVNMGALNNSLEVARQHHCALFTPSSIGAFGPSSPKDKTPQVSARSRARCWATTTTINTAWIPVRCASRALSPTSRCRAAVRPTTPSRSTTRRSGRAGSPALCRRTSIWT